MGSFFMSIQKKNCIPRKHTKMYTKDTPSMGKKKLHFMWKKLTSAHTSHLALGKISTWNLDGSTILFCTFYIYMYLHVFGCVSVYLYSFYMKTLLNYMKVLSYRYGGYVYLGVVGIYTPPPHPPPIIKYIFCTGKPHTHTFSHTHTQRQI